MAEECGAMLSVKNVSKTFRYGMLNKSEVNALRDVSFSLSRGETLGLVGESGCGKTTLGRVIIRLLEPTSGKIAINGIDITKLNRRKFKKYRTKLQMIFQDPRTSLNPRMKISDCLTEGLDLQGNHNEGMLYELLDTVNLRQEILDRYPHEVSGGEIQRVVIARAFSLDPDLIVADEPTSNLDVSVQAQVLNLLKDLQDEHKITYILISHDLEVVRSVSDRIAVMLAGRIVEEGSAERVINEPLHPYTIDLKAASSLEGTVAEEENFSTSCNGGCPYFHRCSRAADICLRKEPHLKGSDHKVACIMA
ncbi:MAG: ATP-binding cassette domain-containing protein [Archaeoglobaceae archaeon]